MRGLYGRLREFEWMSSLWAAALEWKFAAGIVAVVSGMIAATVTALLSAAEWINGFGAAGWVLAGVAVIIIGSLAVGMVAWAWHRARIILDGHQASSKEAALSRAKADVARDESLRSIERSVFLMSTILIEDATYRALWKARNTAPQFPDAANSDADMLRVAESVNDYTNETQRLLRNTKWYGDLSSVVRDVKAETDVRLRTAAYPADRQPAIYREYVIAISQLEAVEDFIKRVISNTDNFRDDVVDKLRDHKAVHERT